ncbi:Translation initiation factor IF-2 [Hypsizygus marmoreus]|uniref:Translation initiation factor IF-2, mitochondrial n=1 Tax=Hypsizygus marmoreus TaxID=39966 RepID=A0A369JI22_HYPMA|nr:Translation initiation factor IF-2 [Hypsizygus marmoreus]
MHRHRKAWRLVQSSCSQSRSAATAAQTKDQVRTASCPPALPSHPISINPSADTGKQRGTDKWFRPPPPRPPLLAARPTDTRLKPTSPSSSTKPQQLSKASPPVDALNKWARNTPVSSSHVPHRDESALSHENIPPSRSDPRLQRDVAPHQDPLATSKSASRQSMSSAQQGSHTSHQRQSLMERTFGSRPSINSGVSEPPIRTRSERDIPWRSPSKIDPPTLASRYVRSERPSRTAFKERGSLLSKIRQNAYPTDSMQPVQIPNSNKVKKTKVVEKRASADVYIPSTVSVGTLARLLGVRLEQLQRQMRQAGMAEEAEYDHVLTSDYAVLLAEEFGRHPIVNDEAAFDVYPPPPHSHPSCLESRPPVVTIMGHVDHGKTTLLDSLRSSSVAKGEAGGITQHIGAFSVPVPATSSNVDGPRSITFLDTPGHAAFSAMRARGAGVTDIIVLVVAADDGIMPQTKEVINLIKKEASKTGVVVAINKVDKPGVDVDAVQKALMAEDLQLEVFGGDIPSVEVSGLSGQGLPTLVETLSAIAEMQDLRAEKDGPIQGYVLESKVHKGLGPVATVLVLRGCLKPGSHIISGVSHAKVRAMNDSTGASVKEAYPGTAITVSGWKSLPNAGDEVLQGTETEVKKAVANRVRKAEIEATLVDVEAINSTRRQERERRELELEIGDLAKEFPSQSTSQPTEKGPKQLRLIIKADVSGSAEAVEGALQGIGNKEAVTRVVSSSVGDISESDVMMAKAVGGTIVGFSVSTPRAIETLAAQNDVPIVTSNVIYRLMDSIKERVIGLLPVIIETRVTGEAVVLQLFDIQLKAKQTKTVAGCRVVNGVVEKGKFARLVRNGDIIHEGMLDTVRIMKKDVTEVRKGTECGLCFGTTFADLQEGDVIQVYEKLEKPGVL